MDSVTPSTVDTSDFLANVAAKSDGAELRGDYSKIDAQYVVQQEWERYTEEDHELWRKLYARQMKLLPGRACQEFIEGLETMNAADQIPRFEETNNILFPKTGWKLVAVPGLVPDDVFFTHLANRRFPVTVWLRTPAEFDYIVEPDVFHDYFGHVPLLFNPIFADHLQEYGKGGLKAMQLGGLPNLARLYWYTVEFGLIRQPEGLRIYGAGILSSGGEVEYSLTSKDSLHVPLQVERVMNTLFKIDSYQETYFVIDSFQQLFDDTAPDFTPMYQRLATQTPYPANTLLEGESNLALD
ncbi:MAG: Phenylalanine-4-hydroxylase [Pseudomonadota bacterium]|jgi:phenylalanine-4-hydroxylase